VSHLAKALQCFITFSVLSCIVQELQTKKVIVKRYEQDILYYLQYSNQPKVGSSALVCNEFAIQWHFRLGHASLKFIKSLFSFVKNISKLECESCQFGKHHRTLFSSRVVNRCSSPFEIVHIDIWGSTRVKSVSDFSYFVSFIDEYSCIT